MRRKRHASGRLPKLLSLGAAVCIAAFLAIGFSFAGSGDRIAEGVTIAGVNVGGLDRAATDRALQEVNARFARTTLVLRAGRHSFLVTASQLDVAPDWRSAVSSAQARGGGFGPLRGIRRLYLKIAGADITPSTKVSERAVDAWLARVGASLNARPKSAALKLRALRPLIVAGRAGTRLDRKAAAARLVASFAEFTFERKPLTLPLRIVAPQVTAADLRPIEAQLRTALATPVRLALGRTRYRLSRRRIAQILLAPEQGVRQLEIGGPGAARYFTRLAKAVATPARDARFAASATQVRIIPARDAQALDVRATAKNLLAALLSGRGRIAKIAVHSKPARRTTQDAQEMGVRALLATETAEVGGFASSAHNAQLVARLIDNTLIAPGRTFSFNQTAGARTAERGFQLAPVIVNDEVRDGFGGGVCDVSTLIFNAAFDAGLRITDRTNHSLYTSHYPQGRDATVDYPDVDLKFVNDTRHWLLLRTFVGSSTLTVSLFGAPLHRKVVSETAPLVVTGPPPVKRVKDATLPRGKHVLKDPGSPARYTSVRRLVYDQHGKLIDDDVWSSSYHAQPRVIRIGTKPPPPVKTPEVVIRSPERLGPPH